MLPNDKCTLVQSVCFHNEPKGPVLRWGCTQLESHIRCPVHLDSKWVVLLSLSDHPYQSHTVYTNQQAVVSQHAKRAPSITSPSIHSTAADPNRVKEQQRRIGNGERHSNATADADSPSAKLDNKTKTIASKIIFDPIYGGFENSGEHALVMLGKRTALAFLISSIAFSVQAQKLGCVVLAIELIQGNAMCTHNDVSGFYGCETYQTRASSE